MGLDLALICIVIILLSGCVNDGSYRSFDPKTCITTPLTNSGCTEVEASTNRAKFFDQCKNLGGTPSMRTFPSNAIGKQPILGVDCLTPDGQIRDLYGEKFKVDTGNDLFN